MSEVTRYRLIGSVFLLAVAAIFLPMIFDAPPPAGQTIAAQGVDSEEVPMQQVLAIDDDMQARITQMKAEQSAMNRVIAESNMQQRVEKLREQVDEDGYWVDNGTRFGEPILLPIRDDTKTFAVQLATFDEQANAKKLREQLRKDGEEAFISQYKQRGISGEKIRYRVAVGPMLSHTLAKQKRTSYTEKYEVKAIVVAMSQ